jgi:hypothetical protein
MTGGEMLFLSLRQKSQIFVTALIRGRLLRADDIRPYRFHANR